MKYIDKKYKSQEVGLSGYVAIVIASALLLQLPAAYGHIYLGRWVYGRDLLILLVFSFGVIFDRGIWLKGTRRVSWLYIYMILMSSVMIFIAFGDVYNRLDALLVLKWIMLWAAGLFSGYHLCRIFGRKALVIFLGVIALYCISELLVGFWEIRSGHYFVAMGASEETATGLRLGVSQQLDGEMLRVRGMQRSVFQFANLMGLGIVALLALGVLLKRWKWLATLLLLGVLPFAYVLVKSGGRSAIIGVLAALVWGGWFVVFRRSAVSNVFLLLASWGSIAVVTFTGIGRLISMIVAYMGFNAAWANANSSYMRDDQWGEAVNRMIKDPVALLMGVSLTGAGYEKLQVTDNWLIWNFYHLGVWGIVVWLMASIGMVKVFARNPIGWVGLIAMGFVVGESLARESYFFFSSIVLFFLIGAAQAHERDGRSVLPVFESGQFSLSDTANRKR